MSLADTYKSIRNRELIYTACFKMIKDKYNTEVNDSNNTRFKNVANNIISMISNDVMLMKTNNISINEINNRTLVKIKEYLDSNPNIFSDEVDDLALKLQELEEKRKLSSIILQDENIDDANINANAINSSMPSNISNTPNAIASKDITMLSDAVCKIIEKQKQPICKTLIINSQNRDWVHNPARHTLKFNINIDTFAHNILPHCILFPKNVKNLTPYITMHVSDGAKTQKYTFAYSKTLGVWDKWTLLITSVENISLKNKTWNISLYDWMNKALQLGTDNISICEICKHADQGFILKLSENLEYLEERNTVLLKTRDDDIEPVEIYRISGDEYIFKAINELEQEDFINAKILDLKAQYSIVLSYSII